jgi:transporter family-2 protein
MDPRVLAAAATVVAGALVALQAPINSKLGGRTGTFPAVTISFAVGVMILVALLAVLGQLGGIGEARGAPWWYFLGGVLGVVYVTTVLLSVRELGAGGVTAATIAGQLTLSLVIDQLGLLGVARQPITAARAAGVLLLAAGVWLVVRD